MQPLPAEAEKDILAQVRYITECSVVRLPDGRLGVLSKHTANRKPAVRVTPQYSVQVKPSDELEVVMWPAESAFHFIDSNRPASAASAAAEEAIGLIRKAWFSRASGLIDGGPADPLFAAIAAELTANVRNGAGDLDDLNEMDTALDALLNDLERVRAAVRKAMNCEHGELLGRCRTCAALEHSDVAGDRARGT